MDEQNQKKTEETPKNPLGARPAVKSSGWKRTLSKKWVSPAAFMAAAAIIVTLMWIYQGTDQKSATSEKTGTGQVSQGDNAAQQQKDDTIAVSKADAGIQWPVADFSAMTVVTPFYDATASSEEKQAAMIQSGNTYLPNMGVNLAKADNSAFDVMAALGGKVTLVEQHPTNGNEVEITAPDGLVTVYQSLSGVQVKEGDDVKQGTVIAKAGRSELEKDLGVHLHFEVRENGKAVNPASVIQAQ